MRQLRGALLALVLLAPFASAKDPEGDYLGDASAVAALVDAAIHAARTAVTKGTVGELNDREVAHALKQQREKLDVAGAQLAWAQAPRPLARAHDQLTRAIDGYAHALALLERCYRANDDGSCAQAYGVISASEWLRQQALADYGR